MTKTFKAGKAAALILAVAMIVSMVCVAGMTTASAYTNKVTLYSADVTYSHWGSETYEVFIQTKDNASEQAVYVHYYSDLASGWRDAQADYVTTLSDGSKIWKAVFSTLGCKYALKYVGDGVAYWDNNSGNDYTGAKLGTAPVAAKRNFKSYDLSRYKIDAVLQNYAYNKNVFVRYTTDGWNTYSDAALSYDATNSDGTETWTTNIDISAIKSYDDYDKFEYAVCYRVNGTEYWANYFGSNYGMNYYISL